jgi:dUTP pyrophosphatase
VRVILLNTDPAEPFTIRRGDRIAQLVIQPVVRARFIAVEELPPHAGPADGEPRAAERPPPRVRGEGGFGSTGR